MGGCCCGLQGHGTHLTHSTTEPLLRDSEREAVSAILKFLDSDSSGIRTLSEDKLQSLYTLSFSDNVDLQKSAALCFSEISETWHEPVDKHFLEPIIHLLLSEDVDIQKAASLALSNLALKGPAENKSTIVKAGALPPLILLLTKDDPEVQCNACGCITTLATTDNNKKDIVSHGAINPLLKLSHVNDSRVQRNAAGALLNLTHIESNRQELVQTGAVPVFVRLLESRDVDVQFYCAAAISNLAVHDSHRRVIVGYGNGKAIRVLVSLMKSNSDKVKCQACLAIRNLASDEANQGKIVESGGLEALVPLLSSKDIDTVTAAVAALRNLSIRKGNEVPIVQSGSLPQLSQLLSLQECPEIQCHAAGTLRNLAAEDQYTPIMESGCLLALAERLRDSQHVSGDVLSEASAALAVMASHVVARKQMMLLYGGNFHKVLLKLTESPYKEVQYNCAGIIGHLAMNEEYHAPLLEEDPSAIGFLLGFMQHDDVSFVHLALWIMAQFSNGSKKTKQMMRKSILLDKIMDLRTRTHSLEISQLADAAFNNLKQDLGDSSF